MKVWPLFLAFLLAACGTGRVSTQKGTDPDLSLSAGETLYVAAANFFSDPVASIATMGLDAPHPIATARVVTDSSDVLVRGFDGKLFVINRGTGSIQVFDPDTFDLLGNYSVGPLSNPQDLIVHNDRAFITRLGAHLENNTDDLWVVEPESGNIVTTVDLKPLTDNDGERLARATQMALVGDTLFILLQDLDANYKAITHGKIAVLDTATLTLADADPNTNGTQAIALTGRNPTSIRYLQSIHRLFVTDTGYFDDQFNNDPATPYGGIEVIRPDTLTTLGIVLDDLGFGGNLSSLVFVSDTLALVTVEAARIASFNPLALKILKIGLYDSPGGFLQELLVDPDGKLWVPERNPQGGGMIRLNPADGSVLAGPLDVGALPASMALIP